MTPEESAKLVEVLKHIIETCETLHIRLPSRAWVNSLGGVTHSASDPRGMLDVARDVLKGAGVEE